MPFTTIKIPPENRDSLLRLKLRVSAEVGRSISMGEMIGYLVQFGDSHISELAKLAKRGRSKP